MVTTTGHPVRRVRLDELPASSGGPSGRPRARRQVALSKRRLVEFRAPAGRAAPAQRCEWTEERCLPGARRGTAGL